MVLCALAALLARPDAAPAAPPIPLVSGSFTPPAAFETALLRDGGLTPQHVLVQLYGAPSPVQRRRWADRGLALLAPLPGDAFLAAWRGGATPRRENLPDVRYLGPLTAADRLDPRLLDRRFVESLKRDGVAPVAVTLFADEPFAAAREVADRVGGFVADEVDALRLAVVHAYPERVAELAFDERVQFVAPAPPPLGPLNDGVRRNVHAEEVWDPDAEYGWNGEGVTGFVYDVAYLNSPYTEIHDDLVDRAQQIDEPDPDYYDEHTGHVTCTFCGSGAASDGLYAGVAPGAKAIVAAVQASGAWYSKPGDIMKDYRNAIQDHAADLATNSIGTNVTYNLLPCSWEGDYNVVAQLIDAIAAGHFGRRLPIFWAAGNENDVNCFPQLWPACRCFRDDYPGYFLIAPPSTTKNAIVVGAVKSEASQLAYFSSWGPTDDGRLKPTVVAPGAQGGLEFGVASCGFYNLYEDMEGTSMATPAAAGVGALLIQGLRELWGVANPPNDLLKALIIAGAEDLPPAGPDYRHGFGRVRAHVSAELVRRGAFAMGEASSDGDVRFRAQASGDEPLTIVLTWDDAPAEPNSAKQLRNDLDLRLSGPDGVERLPFALDPAHPDRLASRGEDHLNVEEQIVVARPAPGEYVVTVRAAYLPDGPWPFALAGLALEACAAAETCDDGVDNDCNRLVDGDDPACAAPPADDDASPGDDDNDDDNGGGDDDEDDSGCGC